MRMLCQSTWITVGITQQVNNRFKLVNEHPDRWGPVCKIAEDIFWNVRLEVSTAVLLKIRALWDVMFCHWISVSWWFEECSAFRVLILSREHDIANVKWRGVGNFKLCWQIFMCCWPCILVIFDFMFQLNAPFVYYIYHIPLHVSSDIALIIRRIHWIHTAYGSLYFTLLRWPLSAQAVRGL